MSNAPTDPSGRNLGNVSGSSSSSGGLDPKTIGLDLTDISTETIEKIAKIVESANSIMTESEKRQKELQQQKLYDYQNKLNDAIERESMKEIFVIPKDTGKQYKFIGYNMDQFEEIMETANLSDNIPAKERGSKKHLRMQTEVWKKTIKYSLDGIPDEIINKIPKQHMNWLYLVLKEKNENPLPFDLTA